jgi:hypothetical protein
VFVRGLEETAEGCRWLLQRWAEFANLMNHKSWWGTAPMVRFIRLQGKHPVEAFYDPALNSIFLAWDVLAPKAIETFWHLYRTSASLCDPANSHLLKWAALGPRPQDQMEAWSILHDVVDQHVGRIEDLLSRHEAMTAEEAAARADRAALDCSKEFERHRRYQSARTRELLRTLGMLQKLRNLEFGTEHEEGEMTDDIGHRADNTCRMADDRGDVMLGGQSGEPTPQVSQGSIARWVAPDAVRHPANEENGSLPIEESDADVRQCLGPSIRQCLPSELNAPEKARNEAKVDSTQAYFSLDLEQSASGMVDGEQTHSAAGGTVAHAAERGESMEGGGKCPTAGEAEAGERDADSWLPPPAASLDPALHSQSLTAC